MTFTVTATNGTGTSGSQTFTLTIVGVPPIITLNPTAVTATVIEQRGVIMKFISPEPPRPLDPVSHEECMKGGWSNFNFKNQGQCIRFVETSLDSRLPEPEA